MLKVQIPRGQAARHWTRIAGSRLERQLEEEVVEGGAADLVPEGGEGAGEIRELLAREGQVPGPEHARGLAPSVAGEPARDRGPRRRLQHDDVLADEVAQDRLRRAVRDHAPAGE